MNLATEIRERARICAGELLVDLKAAGVLREGRPTKNGSFAEPYSLTLSTLGIDKKESAATQRLARLSKDEQEEHVRRSCEVASKAVRKAERDAIKEAERKAQRAATYEARILDGCTEEELRDLAASGQRFSVIYADPPWSFEVYSGKGKARSAEKEYDTQSVEWLCSLPIAQLAAPDCALFLCTCRTTFLAPSASSRHGGSTTRRSDLFG